MLRGTLSGRAVEFWIWVSYGPRAVFCSCWRVGRTRVLMTVKAWASAVSFSEKTISDGQLNRQSPLTWTRYGAYGSGRKVTPLVCRPMLIWVVTTCVGVPAV